MSSRETQFENTRRQHARDQGMRELSDLLTRRTELRGLNATVDHMVDAVTWSV